MGRPPSIPAEKKTRMGLLKVWLTLGFMPPGQLL